MAGRPLAREVPACEGLFEMHGPVKGSAVSLRPWRAWREAVFFVVGLVIHQAALLAFDQACCGRKSAGIKSGRTCACGKLLYRLQYGGKVFLRVSLLVRSIRSFERCQILISGFEKHLQRILRPPGESDLRADWFARDHSESTVQVSLMNALVEIEHGLQLCALSRLGRSVGCDHGVFGGSQDPRSLGGVQAVPGGLINVHPR